MATNAYLDRMGELEAQRRQKQDDTLQSSGLPINRPQKEQQTGVPSGTSPKTEEDESYKNSTFYQNFDHFQQNDPYFGGVMKELTDLATGLREQVNQGYMPQQIAEQRLHQFVSDTSSHYQRNEKPLLEKAEKEKQQEAVMGIINQYVDKPGAEQAPEQGQEIPIEGVSPEKAAQMQGGMNGQ